MPDVSPVVEKTAASSKRSSLKRQREADSESDDEPRQFRRVHIRCRQRAKKWGSQDGAGFETLSKSGTRTIRCICGERDDLGLLENASDHAPPTRTAETWLIQCVNCKVWQHRSCVGTANGNDPSGGWYCEQCSKVKPIHGLLNGDVEERTSKSTTEDEDNNESNSYLETRGRCHSCNTGESSEWRGGPDGPRTLCYLCGLRRCPSRCSDWRFLTISRLRSARGTKPETVKHNPRSLRSRRPNGQSNSYDSRRRRTKDCMASQSQNSLF